MSENNKLAEVNATLDRFAKLIEENAQQLLKEKEEFDRQLAKDREEAKRQRAEDQAEEKKRRAEEEAKRQAEEAKRQAEEAKRQAEWERQRAEDRAKEEKRQAEWEERQAEWERQRAEDKAKDEKRQAEWEQQRAEDKAKDEKRQAEWEERFGNMCNQVGGHGNSIGEITEAITVSGNTIDLLNKFDGIDVGDLYFNVRKEFPVKTADGKSIRKQHEVDGLADGNEVIVVIEAKTSLTEERVERFLDRLARFRIAYPNSADKDLYGAMTFIRIDNEAHQLAERHGLFLIKASPPNVELANSKDFKPTKINWLLGVRGNPVSTLP